MHGIASQTFGLYLLPLLQCVHNLLPGACWCGVSAGSQASPTNPLHTFTICHFTSWLGLTMAPRGLHFAGEHVPGAQRRLCQALLVNLSMLGVVVPLDQ